MNEETKRAEREVHFSSERAKAFVDAVVAIALTLLILPLMEGVAGHTTEKGSGLSSAGEWFAEHQWTLISFVLSFGIVAMFWMLHHRLYARVERISSVLLWLNLGWLLTIVWLPVATALIGATADYDPVAESCYVGAMIASALLMLAMRAVLRAHPELHDIPEAELRGGMATDLAMAALFALALVLMLTVRPVGYFWLFLLMLTGPLQGLVARAMGVRR